METFLDEPDLSVQLSRSLARVHGIKAVQPQAQPGVLDVLIAPFWGPNNGRDAHGQYFTPETEFMHDVIPTPPVFFYHGAEMGEAPTPIGKSADRWVDDLGVWQTVMLDMAEPTARRTWQAFIEPPTARVFRRVRRTFSPSFRHSRSPQTMHSSNRSTGSSGRSV